MTAAAEGQPTSIYLDVQLANEAVVFAGERLTAHITFDAGSAASTNSEQSLGSDLLESSPSVLRLGSQSLADLSQSLLQIPSLQVQSSEENLQDDYGENEHVLPGTRMPFEQQHTANELAAVETELLLEEQQIVKASSIQKKLLQPYSSTQPSTESAASSFLSWLWPFGGGGGVVSGAATMTDPADTLPSSNEDEDSEKPTSTLQEPQSSPQSLQTIPVIALQPTNKPPQPDPIRPERGLQVQQLKQQQQRSNRFSVPSEAGRSSRSASPSRLVEDQLSSLNFDRLSVTGGPSPNIGMREFSGTWQSISSTAEHSPSLAATTSAANLGSLKRQPVRPPPFRDLKQRAQQMDTLALGFIQTVGYLTVDKNWMKLPAEVEETKRMFNADVGGASLRAVYDLLSADSKAVPVFITPPEVLFGSMKLAFGEQKSYYLPPTHRGRAMKISYKVIIGIQRSIFEKPRLFQIPFRVFHKLDSSGLFAEYPLAHPAVIGPNECISYEADDFPKSPLSPGARLQEETDVLDFISRANVLSDNLEHFSLSPKHESLPEKRGQTLDVIIGLCHGSKRASFDICKNNIHVANIHLHKSAFRLGESITGVIDLADALIPCFHSSIFLECTEHIEPGYAGRTAHELSREACTVVAEWHEFCLSTKRTGFSLAISTMASPDFQTTGVGVSWQLRIEFCTTRQDSRPIFKVDLSELNEIQEIACSVAPGSPHKSPVKGQQQFTNGLLLDHSTTDDEIAAKGYDSTLKFRAFDTVDVETFECVLPVRVYGTDWEAGMLYPPSARYRL